MVRITTDTWPQIYANSTNIFHKPQKGDIQIDLPFLDYDQEENAQIYFHEDSIVRSDRFDIGLVRDITIKCHCVRGEMVPKFGLYYPNCEYVPKKIRDYTVSMILWDKNNNSRKLSLRISNLWYIISAIQNYINPLLQEGYMVETFNEEWINWQCTTWNCSEANGQGRSFTFYENDIRSIDMLYDYLKNFTIKGLYHSLPKRGGGNTWTEIEIEFISIDNYVNSLIAKALNAYSSQLDNKVSFKIKYDYDSFEGYCPYIEQTLTDEQAEEYRERVFKQLIIGVLRNFDIEKMKRLRFLSL